MKKKPNDCIIKALRNRLIRPYKELLKSELKIIISVAVIYILAVLYMALRWNEPEIKEFFIIYTIVIGAGEAMMITNYIKHCLHFKKVQNRKIY